MKSPGEGGVGQQPGLDVGAAEDQDPVSWGQRYKDARRRLDKVEQDISKLEAELGQAWDPRKDEKLKQLQQRMVYLEREKADLQEERNLVLKRETTATETASNAGAQEEGPIRGEDLLPPAFLRSLARHFAECITTWLNDTRAGESDALLGKNAHNHPHGD